jgi:Protein of unknown function (DUF3572)
MPIRAKVSAAAAKEAAETLALQGLAFLFEDPARMESFLKLTGLEPAEVRERVGTPELSLAVLEHLAGDESLLLVFTASRSAEPESVGRAIALLEGARQ